MSSERKIKGGWKVRERSLAEYDAALHTVLARVECGQLTGKHGNVTAMSVKGAKNFTGTRSADEYASMLRYGWPDGVSGMAEALDGITSDQAERLEFVRNVAGAFPIVPAHIAGSPLSMLMPTQQRSDQVRGLTLVINGSYPCMVDSSTALEYARSVMRLVAWLQAERLDAAIYIASAMRLEQTHAVYITPIRSLGSVYQPERIAAACHTSFLRRAWFAMLELEYVDQGLAGASACRECYGYPQTLTTEMLRNILPDAESVILMPAVGSHDPTRAVQEAINVRLGRSLK